MSSTSGFTIVRNATLLNYPFRESVRSLIPLCDEVIINCGDSEDDTAEVCEELAREFPGRIHVFHTTWRRENQKGGFQLKHQTDQAIARCRGTWCFYLQADEVLHEGDYDRIRAARDRAGGIEAVDGVAFEYLHFYGGYEYVIRGREWYRFETRLFKNGRGVEAFRDAQGFRRDGRRLRVIPSGARVFHYGYVRTPQGLATKARQMSQWWGEAAPEGQNANQLVRHVGLTRFAATHPGVMEERARKYANLFDPSRCPRRWDRRELKNALTLLWESLFSFRIGEFRNHEWHRG